MLRYTTKICGRITPQYIYLYPNKQALLESHPHYIANSEASVDQILQNAVKSTYGFVFIDIPINITVDRDGYNVGISVLPINELAASSLINNTYEEEEEEEYDDDDDDDYEEYDEDDE